MIESAGGEGIFIEAECVRWRRGQEDGTGNRQYLWTFGLRRQ